MADQRLLARQGGLITRQQALRVGVSAATVTRRLREREWFAVFPGVYRHCAAAVDDELMARAAAMWANPDAVLSGRTAAWWHGLGPAPIGDVTITVPLSSARRSRAGVDVRRRNLGSADVQTLRGVRVVRRAVAALESAESIGGEDILDTALQRYVRTTELSAALAGFGRARGSKAARLLLGPRMDGTVSPAERELAAALRAAGLHQVKPGIRVCLDGTLLWLDFAVEELRLVIEIDGVVAHTSAGTFHHDRERQNLLVTHHWTVLRYTPKQVRADPAAVVGQIAATIDDLGG